MSSLEKAELELAAGNVWRAKEILQGSLPYNGYNTEVFETLGTVLLRMGDLPEAGKFLFLSGVRKPEYTEAVSIFLKKHGSRRQNLLQTFPRVAKLNSISEYPVAVQETLRAFKLSETLRRPSIDFKSPAATDHRVILIGFWLVVLAVLFLLVLGIVKLKEIIFW
jgi:hypothetical protein